MALSTANRWRKLLLVASEFSTELGGSKLPIRAGQLNAR